jgi:hypothetical protein
VLWTRLDVVLQAQPLAQQAPAQAVVLGDQRDQLIEAGEQLAHHRMAGGAKGGVGPARRVLRQDLPADRFGLSPDRQAGRNLRLNRTRVFDHAAADSTCHARPAKPRPGKNLVAVPGVRHDWGPAATRPAGPPRPSFGCRPRLGRSRPGRRLPAAGCRLPAAGRHIARCSPTRAGELSIFGRTPHLC